MKVWNPIAALILTSGVLLGSSMARAFELVSPDVKPGEQIDNRFAFNDFGCTGQNISPALAWKDPPAGTKSFAIFVHDPDAKSGGAGFWHYVLVDVPADVRSLATASGGAGSGKFPPGARLINTDFGAPGWGGPCPPVGDPAHRYIFTIYALKVEKLPVPPNATASLAGFVTNLHAMGVASFTAKYGR